MQSEQSAPVSRLSMKAWGVLFLILCVECSILLSPSDEERYGVVTRAPRFAKGPIPSAVQAYADAFDATKGAATRKPIVPLDATNLVVGEVFSNDSSPRGDLQVVLSDFRGSSKTGRHLYVKTASTKEWKELKLPRSLRSVWLSRAFAVDLQGKPYLLLEGHDDGCSTLWTYELATERLHRICPGMWTVISPDHRRAAFIRSVRYWGPYSLHVIELESRNVGTLFSVWESTADSGLWLNYRWSEDSKALEIKGRVGWQEEPESWKERPENLTIHEVRWLYLLEGDRLYDLPR